MQVLFRAEVINLDMLQNNSIKKLTKINERFYAIGHECFGDIEDNQDYYIKQLDGSVFWCNYNTRSINFENMIDKQKNKIFASMQGNREYGDIIIDDLGRKGIVVFCIFENKPYVKPINISDKDIFNLFNNNGDFEKYAQVIGVQK